MEGRATLNENVIKVVSFAFEDCLAHNNYCESVKESLPDRYQDYSALDQQALISSKLIECNKFFLNLVAQDAIASTASVAILLNGSAMRQSIRSDRDNADNGRGLFFFAQEPLVQKLNAYSGAGGTLWRRDEYVLADTHNDKNPGDTYKAKDDKDLAESAFVDPSNLLLLHTQMFKMARDYKNKTIKFDFYSGDIEANKQLHLFLDANKDFIPRNLRLRIRGYRGTAKIVPGADPVPDIEDLPEIIGECDVELDFNQAYRNLIEAHVNDNSLRRDILATFMPQESASAAEKLAAAEKLKAFKQSRHDELLELVAAMNKVKQSLPRVGDGNQLTQEAQAFSDSLDNFYAKIDAELTKTKNAIKPAQRANKVPKSDAIAAATRMTGFLNAIDANRSIEDDGQRVNAQIQNLANFSKDFNSDHRFRVLKDVAKGAGISFGMLLLAGAIGAGIGFGVGFALAGPAGAVAVGILGAIIGGAIAAAIGAAVAAPVSGVSIYRKQHERREAEVAATNVLDSDYVQSLCAAAG